MSGGPGGSYGRGMATFLLVHGAFRGGWAWGPVAARLRARGHEVHAPDLPGAGKRWHESHPPVGLDEVLDDLSTYVADHDLREVVLAGHSQGGFLARALVPRLGERVRLLLLLDAPDPGDGQRALDLVPAGGEPPPAPPRDAWMPPSPLSSVSTGGDRVAAARWSRLLTPLSAAIALDPVDLAGAPVLPCRYSFFSDTPPGFPSWHTRSRLDDAGQPYDVLDGPHDAPLAVPGAVAAWLHEQAEMPAG